jgi:hypothetical protein
MEKGDFWPGWDCSVRRIYKWSCLLAGGVTGDCEDILCIFTWYPLHDIHPSPVTQDHWRLTVKFVDML